MFEILKKSTEHWGPLLGFMNQEGKVLIEPQFEQEIIRNGNYFSPAGYAFVKRPRAQQYLVIDRLGQEILKLPKNHSPWGDSLPDENGIFGVCHQVNAENNDLWRVEGRDRYFVGETHYIAMRLDGSTAFTAEIWNSGHGHYVVRNKGLFGVLDGKGQVRIPAMYESILLSPTDPCATVMVKGRANVLRLDGSPVFSRDFEVGDRLVGLRSVQNGLWIVPDFRLGHALVLDVASGSEVGILPLTSGSRSMPRMCPSLSGGVVLIRRRNEDVAFYRPDGRAAINGLFGLPKWFKAKMQVGYFHDDRASFKAGDLHGYLDITGDRVIPPQFFSDLSFKDGLAKVKYPSDGLSWDRFSYIDKLGNVIWHQED